MWVKLTCLGNPVIPFRQWGPLIKMRRAQTAQINRRLSRSNCRLYNSQHFRICRLELSFFVSSRLSLKEEEEETGRKYPIWREFFPLGFLLACPPCHTSVLTLTHIPTHTHTHTHPYSHTTVSAFGSPFPLCLHLPSRMHRRLLSLWVTGALLLPLCWGEYSLIFELCTG